MPKFSLLSATRSIEATMSFVLYRLLVYLGLAAVFLVAALAGAGTLIAFASFSSKPGTVAGFGAWLGLAGCIYLVYKFRAGLFFNVQAGHLALLAQQALGHKLPEGKAQVEAAKQAAAQALTPELFHRLNAALDGAAADLTGSAMGLLPAPSQPALAGLQQAASRYLARGAARASLALHFRNPTGDPWHTAESGLLALGLNFRPLLIYQLQALALEYAGLAVAFAAMLYPVDSAASLLPVDVGYWRYLFALMFAWSLKSAFFTPIATTAMAQMFFELETPAGVAAQELRDKLLEQSEGFRTLAGNRQAGNEPPPRGQADQADTAGGE
jgi:hypothetical protein